MADEAFPLVSSRRNFDCSGNSSGCSSALKDEATPTTKFFLYCAVVRLMGVGGPAAVISLFCWPSLYLKKSDKKKRETD